MYELTHFPGRTRTKLVEFFKYIAATDTDFTIFLARKALRLYDLGQQAGFPSIQNKIFTHHILDQDLSFMSGKTVTVIDDTLIVGTTLENVHARLHDAGIKEMHIVTFCKDTKWSVANLAPVDKVFMHLAPEDVSTFCAAEIDAFKYLGIPYLTDFPVTGTRRFNSLDVERIFGSIEWVAFSTNAYSNNADCGTAHTFIPTKSTVNYLSTKYNIDFPNLTEVLKVRMFLKPIGDGNYYSKFVPLVTIRSVDPNSLQPIISEISNSLLDNIDLTTLLRTARSKVRFLQHLISAVIYIDFSQSVSRQLHKKRLPVIDYTETSRHFSDQICYVLQLICNEVEASPDNPPYIRYLDKTLSSPLPRSVVSGMVKETVEYLRLSGLRSRRKVFDPRYLFSDLMKIFIEMHNRIEIPTRIQVLKMYQQDGFVDIDKIGTRTRLQSGITWSALLSAITGKEPDWHTRQLTSIYLDKLIDLGIAVPTLVEEGQRVFRGYRHGEDVLLGEQEYALCHIAAENYIRGGSRKSIPRVDAEKLFVLLVKIGAALNFIEEVQGSEHHEQLARVQFHRHGAVVVLDPYVTGTFAGSIENWLTTRLIHRRILIKSGSNYGLGEYPEASFRQKAAKTFAQQLGLLIGELSGKSHGRVIDSNDLILLASASNSIDTLGAVSAELQVFSNMYASFRQALAVDFQSATDVEEKYGALRSHESVQALNSAILKYRGFTNGEFKEIVDRTEAHLSSQLDGAFRLVTWRDFIEQLRINHLDDHDVEISNSIDLCMSSVVELLSIIYLAEMALISWLKRKGHRESNRKYSESCDKIENFYKNIGTKFVDKSRKKSMHTRLQKIILEEQPIEDSAAAVKYAIRELDALTEGARSLCVNASRLAFSVGRQANILTYSSCAWYDIVGSSGESLSDSLDEVAANSGKVSRFTSNVNMFVQELVSRSRSNSHIRRMPDYAMDKDDEKTIYFGGVNSRFNAENIAKQVIKSARQHGLRVRALLYPCNTSGPAPTSLRNRANVEGPTFFQIYSRVKREVTLLSKKLEKDYPTGSLMWLAGIYHNDNFALNDTFVKRLGDVHFIHVEVGGIASSIPLSVYHIE